MSDIDIPDFLLIPQDQRNAGWQGRTLTRWRPGKTQADWRLPKSLDATGRQLLRAAEAIAEEKKRASLAALKAWKEANR